MKSTLAASLIVVMASFTPAQAMSWLYSTPVSEAQDAAAACGATTGRKNFQEIPNWAKVKGCMLDKGYEPITKRGTQFDWVCGWAAKGTRNPLIGDCSGMEG